MTQPTIAHPSILSVHHSIAILVTYSDVGMWELIPVSLHISQSWLISRDDHEFMSIQIDRIANKEVVLQK